MMKLIDLEKELYGENSIRARGDHVCTASGICVPLLTCDCVGCTGAGRGGGGGGRGRGGRGGKGKRGK